MSNSFYIRAFAAHKPGDNLQPYHYPCPQLTEHDVLIAISHCGVCRSDWHFLSNDWGDSHYPVIPGHEIVGQVIERGSQVDYLHQGETVGVSWQVSSCHHCHWCHSQREEFCHELKGLGMNQAGGFADYICVDARFVVPLPASLPKEQAAVFMCAGLTSYNAVRVGQCKEGEHVAIVGIGGLGHMAVQIAKARGCYVTAFIDSTTDVQAVKVLGADQIIHSAQLDSHWHEQFDVIINTVDELQNYDLWLAALKSCGRFVFVSIPTQRFQCDLFPLAIAEKSIIAIPAGNQQLLREWIAFAERHHIKAHVDTLPMNEVNEALKQLSEGRVVFRLVLTNDTD